MFRKNIVVNVVYKSEGSMYSRTQGFSVPWYKSYVLEVSNWIFIEQDKILEEFNEEVLIYNIDIIK